MKPIHTTIDLLEFQKEMERRKEVFKLSTHFDHKNKTQITNNFDELIAICDDLLEAAQPKLDNQL